MEPDPPPLRLAGVDATPVPATRRPQRPTPAALNRDRGGETSAPAPMPLTAPRAHAEFTSFYRSCRDDIGRAVALTIGDRELAAEAVDEAMVRAYQRWSQLTTMDNPEGWVYRVACNWACSGLRRRRRAPQPPWEGDVPGIGPISEPTLIRALAELEVRHRAVVVCRYLLGWSEAETAAALATPIGTVKSRLHRALRLLSSRLSHLRPEEEA